MLKLYHYTDEGAFHSIKREGVIRAGTMNKFGVGVYLTDLDPEEYTREQVAKANYGVGAQRNLERGRLDYHIPILISSHEVIKKTANGYLYPHEILRLDDYSIQNADSNQRWIQLSLQTAMVVGGSALALTGGAVAVVRLFQAADGWLSNRRDTALEQTLDRIITKHSESGSLMMYATKRIGSDGVCIACQLCQVRVTKVYQGGVLWDSHVDHCEVLTRLFKHDEMHLKKVVARLLGAAIAVWMYQYGWRSFIWECSFPVAVGTSIWAGVISIWIATNM
jgi:HYD1 signature containing ADP-ribosyltransferase